MTITKHKDVYIVVQGTKRTTATTRMMAVVKLLAILNK